MSFSWTPSAEATLRMLCADGMPYSQIAETITLMFTQPVTRNACIGKATRMGISDTKPSVRTRTAREPRARRKLGRRRGLPFVFGPSTGIPCDPGPTDLAPDHSECAVGIMHLRENMCRWPLGEPSAGMLYCGAVVEEMVCHGGELRLLSYCPRHARLAYQPRLEAAE